MMLQRSLDARNETVNPGSPADGHVGSFQGRVDHLQMIGGVIGSDSEAPCFFNDAV